MHRGGRLRFPLNLRALWAFVSHYGAREHNVERKPVLNLNIDQECEVETNLECECDAKDDLEHNRSWETEVEGVSWWSRIATTLDQEKRNDMINK